METDLAQRVGEALGVEVVGLSAPPGEGYTNNERRVARLADGRSVFVKAAVDELTAGWLRDEYRVYAAVEEDFLPKLIGWRDEGDRPLLIVEDLSSAYWPPPWDAGQVGALARTLDRIARASPPRGLDPLENRRAYLSGWEQVAEDPEPLLSLGLCSRAWLEAALPTLLGAARACVLAGDSLVHFSM